MSQRSTSDVAEKRKQLLLNLISDVKARLEGKVDSVSFPIPQFIVVGKQSVGKSRLIESLVGEPFNFVCSTLGSRRPTVLELRNVVGVFPNRWYVFDDASHTFIQYPVERVMQIVGSAHESLGTNVTDKPIRVKVEGKDTVDLGLVDLPGFRTYAKDPAMQELGGNIEKLVRKFMSDENNVMLCVEEAGDCAGYSTLGKCREYDPSYRRTILVRNKLDKYYQDLTAENTNKWLEGFGDLPEKLPRFAISLPHWNTPTMPKPFAELRTECSKMDEQTLLAKGVSSKYIGTIGLDRFRHYMEIKTQQLFAEALSPMISRLKCMRDEHQSRLEIIHTEVTMIDENNILHATRQAGICFAQSFNFLMEGTLATETNRRTVEEELKAFQSYCRVTGVLNDSEMSNGMFETLDHYVHYLRDVAEVPGMDVQLNGGAQFKRLMHEVEIFTRFAGLGHQFRREDIIQARGSGLHESTWENVINHLMVHNAPIRMKEKTKYVGERLNWFFMEQKECVLDFMMKIRGSPEEHLYSRRLYDQAAVIRRNEAMKALIFEAFDDTCRRHRESFMQMWNDWMNSMFQSPLKLMKAGSMPGISVDVSYESEIAPTFESTKARIESERLGRDALQSKMRCQMAKIPTDDSRAAEAVMMVQNVVEETFGRIRSAVSDQMELYSKSFFLLPMLRRLEGDMAKLELRENDKRRYNARKTILKEEKVKSDGILKDLIDCIDNVQKFKLTFGGGD